MAEAVLDASALLAILRREPGADRVGAVLGRACISAVNLAEVYCKMAEYGKPPEATAAQITRLRIPVIAFDAGQAALVASLWKSTRTAGLSLSDRACLALAMHLDLPAMTTEREWVRCQLPVRITTIR